MTERTRGTNGRCVFTAILAMAASLAALGAAPRPAGGETHHTPSPGKAVSLVSAAVAAAANAHDAALIGKHYAQEAILLPPDHEVVRGRAAIEEFWKGRFAKGLGEILIASMGSGASGDLGYDAGTYHLTLTPPGAQPVVERGKYLTVMRRGKDGRWRITYDIWNSNPLAAPAPAR